MLSENRSIYFTIHTRPFDNPKVLPRHSRCQQPRPFDTLSCIRSYLLRAFPNWSMQSLRIARSTDSIGLFWSVEEKIERSPSSNDLFIYKDSRW